MPKNKTIDMSILDMGGKTYDLKPLVELLEMEFDADFEVAAGEIDHVIQRIACTPIAVEADPIEVASNFQTLYLFRDVLWKIANSLLVFTLLTSILQSFF